MPDDPSLANTIYGWRHATHEPNVVSHASKPTILEKPLSRTGHSPAERL